MAKILLAEDDLELAPMIKDYLNFERHVVEVTADGMAALQLAEEFKFDLIILDWGLPGLSGVEICKRLRQREEYTPILMLTGKDTVQEKEMGLDAGADDYVTKPFHMRELSARVRAILRRPKTFASAVLKAGQCTLDPGNYRFYKNGEEVHLLPKEFALLEFLMRHPGVIFSLEALLERVWSSEADVTVDAVRTCMTRLRRKIDAKDSDSIIESIHGRGYRLKP